MNSDQPFFSIIIPTYARPVPLSNCLRSIAGLEYPQDRYEVIVVDDGGPAGLEGKTAEIPERIPLKLMSQAHAGPAAARNSGIAEACGDFLVFIDDDCIVTPDYLKRLAACFASAPDAGIGGRTINALPENIYSSASQLHVDYLYAYYDANAENALFFSSDNIAFPAGRFRECGAFDPSFITGEDREVCQRWRAHGNRLVYRPDVVLYHAHVLTFRSYWSQHFNYGRGAFRLRTSNARRDGRFALERKSFYLRMLLYREPKAGLWRVWRIRFLFAVGQAANAAGFLWESCTGRRV